MTTLTPADCVIGYFGVRPLARDLQVDPSTVIRWRHGDGLVPSDYHRRLLALAKRKGYGLTADELINGRKVRSRA